MPSSSPYSKSDFLAGDNPVFFFNVPTWAPWLTFGDCFFVSALDMLHIFHQSLVLAVPVFQIGTLWAFFPPSYMPLSSLLFWFCFSSSLWLFLLPFCSASCYSPRHISFFPTCLLSSLHSTELRLKMSFLPPLLAFPKRSFCGASLGTTALCFLFIFILLTSELFLSLSFPRISSKHLSSARHWLPSTCLPFHQAPVGLLILFSLPVPCSCIPAHLHSAAGKGRSGKIGSFTCTALSCWRRYLSPLVKWKICWAGSFPLPAGIHSLPSFSWFSAMLVKPRTGQVVEQTPLGQSQWVMSWVAESETSSEVEIWPQLSMPNTPFACSCLQKSSLLCGDSAWERNKETAVWENWDLIDAGKARFLRKSLIQPLKHGHKLLASVSPESYWCLCLHEYLWQQINLLFGKCPWEHRWGGCAWCWYHLAFPSC